MKYINGPLNSLIKYLLSPNPADESSVSVLFYPGSYTDLANIVELELDVSPHEIPTNIYVMAYEACNIADLLQKMLETSKKAHQLIVWSFMHLVASKAGGTCVAGIVDLVSVFKELRIPSDSLVLADNVFLQREVSFAFDDNSSDGVGELSGDFSDIKMPLQRALERVCEVVSL